MDLDKSIKKEKDFFFLYRENGDDDCSVIAKLYNPHKQFYEHPTLINMDIVDTIFAINELMNDENLTKEKIINEWIYIGD